MDCSSLKDALARIEELYRKEGLSPGRLEQIGYVSRWTLVLASDGQAGMAFNFTGEHAVYGLPDPGELVRMRGLVGKDLFSIAEELLEREGLLTRSLCLAVLNALSRPLSDARRLAARGIASGVPYDYSFVNSGDKVVVIGYGGVAEDLRQRAGTVHISDMRPRGMLETLSIGEQVVYGPPGLVFHGAEENEELLRDADVVLMTGCTLVNDTFRELVRYAKKARVVGMFGPSAQLLPEFLFDRGISYITTSRVLDPAGIYNQLTGHLEGQVFGRFTEPYVITAKPALK